MDVLPLQYRTLRLCGIWYEENENFGVLRKFYRFVVISSIFYLTFTMTFEIARKNSNISEITEVLFLAMTFMTLCFKLINFTFRRDEMIEIINDLKASHCKAKDEAETKILAKHTKAAKWLFVSLLIFVLCDLSYFTYNFASSALKGYRILIYKTYQFYNLSSPVAFYSTAAFQFITGFYSIAINIAFDTGAAGLLMMLTAQAELCAYRLEKLKADDRQMKDCIAHNVLIHEAARKVESFIIGVVVPFFLLSMTSICTSIFQVSKYDLFSLDFVGLCTFAICILMQVLVYCWTGNEFTLKSEAITNAIYRSEWTTMSCRERKNLNVLMICNKKIRSISCGGQCKLNLETFVWIVKTSYATVSLLHQVNRSV